MLPEIRVSALAKINLNLRVLPIRADGFHEIQSIFQTVNLFDELSVRVESGSGLCSVSCKGFTLPKENTLTLAYKAFCKTVDFVPPSVSVGLIKKIPAGGGLGGGSSDAAALVRALESLCGISLSLRQLDTIASIVGSDVFFFTRCIDGHCAAVVSGRGEVIKPIMRRSDLFFVLAFPSVHSSTKEAYRLVDRYVSNDVYLSLDELETVYNSPVNKWGFKNSFTAVLRKKYPEIDFVLKEMGTLGAEYFELSGSGATVFGVFSSQKDAQTAKEVLDCKGIRCVCTV